MSYTCELSTWWVVYKVNPCENQVEVGEVYQDDELLCSFNIDSNSALNSLLGNANDVTVHEEMKHMLRKKEM
jgi:hypothetical protein